MSLSFRFGDPEEDFLWKRDTHTSRYEDYFMEDQDSDLTIRFGNLSFPGHRFVFEDRCPTFYEHYNMDGRGYWDREVKVDDDDCSEEAVMTAVRFVYRGDIVFYAEDLKDVLRLARRYDLDDMFARLTSGPNLKELWQDYAWTFLHFAVEEADEQEDDEDFSWRYYNKVWDKLAEDAEALIALDGFCDLSPDTIEELLSNSDVCAFETSLFNACLRWARTECRSRNWKNVPANWRKLMEPFIHRIRFPLMSLNDFRASPEASGVLHPYEVRLITIAIESGDFSGSGFDYSLRKQPATRALAPTIQSAPNPTPAERAPAPRQVAATARGDANVCKVCMSEEIGIFFRPCGHVAVCATCSPQLSHCPVCRKAITKKVRAFLS